MQVKAPIARKIMWFANLWSQNGELWRNFPTDLLLLPKPTAKMRFIVTHIFQQCVSHCQYRNVSSVALKMSSIPLSVFHLVKLDYFFYSKFPPKSIKYNFHWWKKNAFFFSFSKSGNWSSKELEAVFETCAYK